MKGVALSLIPLALVTCAGTACAQVDPIASSEDARIQTVIYAPAQVVRLTPSPDTSLAVVFASDERIQSVVVGDTASYLVTVAGSQDGLYVRARRAAANTEMSVRTDQRSYQFVLTSASEAKAAPYLVRFSYGPQPFGGGARPQPWTPPPPPGPPVVYKLSGNKELLPAKIHDDGTRTYMEWSVAQAVPAVFALDKLGREEMVNGYMREGQFTIDRVHDHLVFRIDQARADAMRVIKKVRK